MQMQVGNQSNENLVAKAIEPIQRGWEVYIHHKILTYGYDNCAKKRVFYTFIA